MILGEYGDRGMEICNSLGKGEFSAHSSGLVLENRGMEIHNKCRQSFESLVQLIRDFGLPLHVVI